MRLTSDYYPEDDCDWPRAYNLAVGLCVKSGHCGCEDCCGVITPAQRRAVIELACDLVGADYPPPDEWEWEEEGL